MKRLSFKPGDILPTINTTFQLFPFAGALP